MKTSRLVTGFSAFGFALAALLTSGTSAAIPRSQVMSRAKGFAYHPWTCKAENTVASCNSAYVSIYTPGDYVGLPYDWGGYMTLFEFDQAIAAGKGAGSYPEDGILSCTVGLDCSGFVSKAFAAGHYTTSNMANISNAIDVNSILPADIFNYAGYHVAMFSHMMANGEPAFYESLGYNVHYNVTDGWAHVDGYVPRRYTQIEGTTVSDVEGSLVTPIKIDSFPYTDTRNTKDSGSDMLDGCGAAPAKSESGPEYVYAVTFNQPGTLTATISDDAGVDIDIHLYTSMNTNDCVARHDTTITVDVDCGTYYLVADTFKGASEQPGLYTLTATFTPKNQACGSGPPQYSPTGNLGDPCGNPNNPDLPFCNPNLGGEVCLYNDQVSFCTKACSVDSDCAGLGAGSCCGDIGAGELYCFTNALCGGTTPPEEENPPEGGDPNPEDLTSSGAGGTAGAAGSTGLGGGNGGTAGSSGNGAGNVGGEAGSGNAEQGGGCNSSGAPVNTGRLSALLLALAAAAARRRSKLSLQRKT